MSSSPTKEKHPSVISEKAAGWRGEADRSTGGQGEADNTGSRIKREMLSKEGRKGRQREHGAFNL